MVYADPPLRRHLPGVTALSPWSLSAPNTLGVGGVGLCSVVFGYLFCSIITIPGLRDYPMLSGLGFIALFGFSLFSLFSLRYRVDERARQLKVKVKRLGLVTQRVISFDEIRFVFASYCGERGASGYELCLITEGGFLMKLDKITGGGGKEAFAKRKIYVQERLEEYAELFDADPLPIAGSARYFFYARRLAPRGAAPTEPHRRGYLCVHIGLVAALSLLLLCLYIVCFLELKLEPYLDPFWFYALQFFLPSGLFLYALDR